MATRKRATPASDLTFLVSIDTLAAFIGDDRPDTDRLTTALALATAAAAAFTHTTIGNSATHPIRQGIHLLAAHLLITDQLEQQPAEAEIPLVVRAFWSTPHAGPTTV